MRHRFYTLPIIHRQGLPSSKRRWTALLLGAGLVVAGVLPGAVFGQSQLSLPPAVVADTSYGSVDLDLPVLRLDGSLTTLEQYAGQVLFINFWATWCAPCRAELPSIEALAQRLKDENVAVLMISVDQDPAEVREFLEERGVNGTVYIRHWGAGESPFRRAAIPTTYVVSKEGEITYRHTGATNWNTLEFADYLRGLAAPR